MEGTWVDKTKDALTALGRPAQAWQIEAWIKKHKRIKTGSFRIMLSLAVKNKQITAIKYPNQPAFYFHPKWVDDDGKLLDCFTFNPKTLDFNEVANQ